jgi:hypothetical protein
LLQSAVGEEILVTQQRWARIGSIESRLQSCLHVERYTLGSFLKLNKKSQWLTAARGRASCTTFDGSSVLNDIGRVLRPTLAFHLNFITHLSFVDMEQLWTLPCSKSDPGESIQ